MRTGLAGWAAGRRLALAAVVAVLAAPLACVAPDSGGLTVRLSIATGGTGGVYYPYGGGIAKIISEHVEGVEATAEVTAGTVDNLKFIASRSADIAFGLGRLQSTTRPTSAGRSPTSARCPCGRWPSSTTTTTTSSR